MELIPAIRCNPRQKAWDFHYYQGYEISVKLKILFPIKKINFSKKTLAQYDYFKNN